jgi:hypothetical protein
MGLYCHKAITNIIIIIANNKYLQELLMCDHFYESYLHRHLDYDLTTGRIEVYHLSLPSMQLYNVLNLSDKQ